MAEASKGFFHADFTYTDEVLRDFEALYLQKKEISPATRVALGVLGLVGAGYFGWSLYKNGLQFTQVGYLIICSVLLVIACHRPGKRPDDSLAKYRKYYLDKGAAIRVDDSGLEFRLEGQKTRVLRGGRRRRLLALCKQRNTGLHPVPHAVCLPGL